MNRPPEPRLNRPPTADELAFWAVHKDRERQIRNMIDNLESFGFAEPTFIEVEFDGTGTMPRGSAGYQVVGKLQRGTPYEETVCPMCSAGVALANPVEALVWTGQWLRRKLEARTVDAPKVGPDILLDRHGNALM